MRKVVFSVFACALFFSFATIVLAEGGKVQGDNAEGDAYQYCTRVIEGEVDACPFQN
jgi:hypothetical protein